MNTRLARVVAYARTWWPRADVRARHLVADVRALAVWTGYLIRPYDQYADARRWWWQPPSPCGLGAMPADARAALVARLVAASELRAGRIRITPTEHAPHREDQT